MKRTTIVFLLLMAAVFGVNAIEKQQFVFSEKAEGYFPLIVDGTPVSVLSDEKDFKGVQYAVEDLFEDFERVCGKKPGKTTGKQVVIVGTLGQSATIDRIFKDKKMDIKDLKGKREKHLIQVVSNPISGVESALVIAGSDKRGTIYGVYELSAQMGVSPWYYWADVPVAKKNNLYIKPGIYTEGEPAVRYRGIFLNDEAPALSGWSKATFGGFNHQFYENVFELLLRLKANFLWPAMWGSAFYTDDPMNGQLAEDYGIVMSTSHHEPMARSQQEWHKFGNKKAWDYNTNAEGLRDFWKIGIERAKNWETVVTLAMRGDGDEPMSHTANIGLLETIVKDQRKIIEEVTGKKAEATPQVWALYKEVQDYYDEGMRVPDDVTLLFCDDNWGNVRKLPELTAPKRAGGYGMYYHFDYVGAPRNSKWINVSQIQRVWEQMNLTYQYGVDRIWVVNVGDLKPMEYPISFFLDMAWNPNQFNPSNLYNHTVQWCVQQFGPKYAKEAARMINLYTKYNHRITPELLNDRTYSLENYNEFETVRNDYVSLLTDALRLYNLMPVESRDAFDQLVLFPINGCANLYEMYYALAMNKKLALANDEAANQWADKVIECYKRDSLLTIHYNKEMANGKWAHMMDQVRIGYRSWQEPRNTPNNRPKVEYVKAKNKSKIFVENDGYVSIEAENYFKANNGAKVSWVVIPDLGKTKSAITTTPVTEMPDANVYLEYKVDLKTTGDFKLKVLTSPTLNFNSNKGLKFAVSIDGGPEKTINMNGHYRGELGRWQSDRIIETNIDLSVKQAGEHTIRIRVLDPAIVFQKIMLDMGGLKRTYLGAPESQMK